MAMERVFSHPSLTGCLDNLPARSAPVQIGLWNKQKTTFIRAQALVRSLGKPSLTPTQAKKLDSLGLSYILLCKLHRDTGTREAFLTALKEKGIRSKPLREELAKALGPFR